MSNEKITIKIEGMSCGHCEKAINRIVSATSGVSECIASSQNSSADITFDNSKTTKEIIIKAINDSEIYRAM